MGKLPGYLKVHSITIEPLEGVYSHGNKYGDPVTHRCFVDNGTTLQLDSEGNEVVSSARVFMDSGADIPVLSRVTIQRKGAKKRVTYVIDVKERDGGGLPTPDHLELVLR